MADKNSNRQPQSGASKQEKKGFTQLPEKRNDPSQKVKGLAPLLHWDVSDGDDD